MLYDSLARSVQKQQRLTKFLQTREDDTNYQCSELHKKNEERLRMAEEERKRTNRIRIQTLRVNYLHGDWTKECRQQQQKNVMLKRVAGRLRHEELEDFKREQSAQI